jgi:N-acetylneuraminate synthase
MRNLYISERCIGKVEPTFIIAEVGQAHEGSLALAHSFIDSVADTGADAVKFQTHLAEYESTLNEPFRAEFRTVDETRYEYWKRMEFTEAQWTELADHAKRVGLTFLSTAFCKPAVDLLKRVGVPAWKVGSGEYNSMELVAYMAETGFPVLLSTGMSMFEEIGDIVATVNDRGAPLAIFQCTSKYPTEMEDVGLNMLDELADTFGCSVGLQCRNVWNHQRTNAYYYPYD